MFQDFKDLEFEDIGVKIPTPPIEPEEYKSEGVEVGNNLEFLKTLCRKGFKEKCAKYPHIEKNKQAYIDQTIHELDVYEKTLFVDYLLLNWWIVKWCRKENIVVNPRGSAASSLVLYLLGISRVDPIKHELIFERFLSADRISFLSEGRIDPENIGDIDLDLPPEGRSKLTEYLEGVFKDRFCKVITLGTFSSPILLKECCKIGLEYDPKRSEIISKSIPKPAGKAISVSSAKESVAVVKDLFLGNPKIEKFAHLLEGLINSSGSHPSAYLTLAVDIDDSLPVENNKEGELLSSWSMDEGAMDECVKVDLLSVRGLSLIRDVALDAGINPEDIDYEDPFIYKELQNMKNVFGLFQISARIAHDVTKKVKPANINELIDVAAIARPGSLAYLDDYLDFKAEELEDAK